MSAKRQEVTIELRKLIIEHFKDGKSIRKIAEIVKKSHSTVHNIIKRYKVENRIDNKPRSGRPSLLSQVDKRNIIRKIKMNPRLSAPKLASDLQVSTGNCVHPETVRRVIRNANYHGRVARKKFYINEKNRKSRLTFAKSMIKQDIEYWKNVIFVDESKFNIFGSDGRITVWRKPNEELWTKNLTPTVKFGGGGVMVWGCMAAGGVGDLVFIDQIMDHKVYLNILKDHLKSSAEKLGLLNKFHFYQDNDPKHKTNVVRCWLLYNCPKVLETPAQSPDLNPIEHLWAELEKRVRKHEISSKSQLKTILMEEWNKITPEVTSKLVDSIPRRLQNVINAKGYPTKY